MLRRTLLAGLIVVTGCRESLETEPAVDAALSPACQEATMHSDLSFIENSIFKQSCVFSGCHNGNAATDAGKMDLRVGAAHASLVNVDSRIDTTRKFVVPNQVNQSYLMMMIKQVAPEAMTPPASAPDSSVGFMPQTSGDFTPMCVQKRDAIQRWIEAGAPNN